MSRADERAHVHDTTEYFAGAHVLPFPGADIGSERVTGAHSHADEGTYCRAKHLTRTDRPHFYAHGGPKRNKRADTLTPNDYELYTAGRRDSKYVIRRLGRVWRQRFHAVHRLHRNY